MANKFDEWECLGCGAAFPLAEYSCPKCKLGPRDREDDEAAYMTQKIIDEWGDELLEGQDEKMIFKFSQAKIRGRQPFHAEAGLRGEVKTK